MLIAIDSNVFIAALSWLEAGSAAAQQLLRQVTAGEHRAVMSSIVYGEVIGVASGNLDLRLEDFFAAIDNLESMAADNDVCLQAGELRRKYGGKLKLPDALHLATALRAGAEVFITDDAALSSVTSVRVCPLAAWQ